MTPGRARPPRDSDGEVEVISPWEWVVGGLGIVLLLFALAVTLREAARESTPTEIDTRVDSVRAVRHGFLAHITASNTGGTAAAEVRVTGELTPRAGDVVRSSVVFDHMPPRSSVTGGLFFPSDPRLGTLRVRAEGFQGP